jgi:hypothetical protein
MRRALVAHALAAVLLPAALLAHQPPPTYHGRLRQLDVRVPKHAAEINIDGSIDEAAWADAALLTGFSQYAPVDGLAAEDSTEVLVMYSDHAIYFAIRAFETHGEPIATLADRDRIGGDDHIMILLDTFNDRRRAFMFAVNARGVQSDGMMSEGAGGGTDLSPDFLFDSKGRVTPNGYEIEMRVPFKSIRYQPTDTQNWGINVVRRVQHSGHEQTWTPAERGQPSFLAQSGTFLDMTQLRRGLVLDVNPVMTQRTTGAPLSPTDRTWDYRREDPEFGGNVRWGVTSNLTMNGTFRPDFSQVEADVGQVAFDPRAALFFPEKRPFFLEGSENFETPNQLIYTRRITAPEAAAKLNGKIGDLNVGVLSAVDDEGLSATGDDSPLFNLLRLRRDFGAQSTAGLVYTDRIEGDDYNRVAGIDSRAVVAGLIVNGQIASSWTRAGGADMRGVLFDFAVGKPGREFGWNASVDGVHPDFVTEAGFLSRTGVAHANAGPRWTFFRPQGGLIETYSVNTYLDGSWDYRRFEKATFPNDLKWHVNLNASLRGGWRATVMTFLETFKYPAELYTNFYLEQRDAGGVVTDTVPYTATDRLTNIGGMIAFNTPQWQKFSANFNIVGGHDDNFDEWSSAWIALTTIGADWRPTQQIRVNARYLEQRYHRVSDGSLVRLSTIPRVKVEYQVARPFFVRFVGQYNATRVDALRDDSRTEAPILIRNPTTGVFRQSTARESSGFRSDVLLSYQPNPGTVIFAGYGNTLNAPDFFDPGNLNRASDGFFVKVSYLFRL